MFFIDKQARPISRADKERSLAKNGMSSTDRENQDTLDVVAKVLIGHQSPSEVDKKSYFGREKVPFGPKLQRDTFMLAAASPHCIPLQEADFDGREDEIHISQDPSCKKINKSPYKNLEKGWRSGHELSTTAVATRCTIPSLCVLPEQNQSLMEDFVTKQINTPGQQHISSRNIINSKSKSRAAQNASTFSVLAIAR